MQGFMDGVPIIVKASWSDEVPMLAGEATEPGLLAETGNGTGGVTRWFVPWGKLDYIRQDIPAETPGVQPDILTPVAPPAPQG